MAITVNNLMPWQIASGLVLYTPKAVRRDALALLLEIEARAAE